MSYTKGPWKLDEDGWISDSNDNEIMSYLGCGSHQAYIEKEGDGKLLIHAPDLYEALKEIVKCNDLAGSDPAVSQWINSPVYKQCHALLDKLKEIE